MSWASGVHTVKKQDINVIEKPMCYDDATESEHDMQTENASLAAELLARAVGRPGDEMTVEFSGHANPGHGPREGYADEYIVVRVTARPAQPEEPTVGADAVPLEPAVE